MVYESDFYTVRRPYSRPTITSYSVTGYRPCYSIRNAIAPPGTHSRVRMSVLMGELDRIQNRSRPHLSYVPTEDFLCSRSIVDFDDEAKRIRATADRLMRYVYTRVPHNRKSTRIMTAYDRITPDIKFYSYGYYPSSVSTNILNKSYYYEPARITIGRGHLSCISFAGGRGYPKRKHLYSDEFRDIGDEIKFRSYYNKHVHPNRTEDALLLPTGFASRLLLADRKLLRPDEAGPVIFTSKLIKPPPSGLLLTETEKKKDTSEERKKDKLKNRKIDYSGSVEKKSKSWRDDYEEDIPSFSKSIPVSKKETPQEEIYEPPVTRYAPKEPSPEPQREPTPVREEPITEPEPTREATPVREEPIPEPEPTPYKKSIKESKRKEEPPQEIAAEEVEQNDIPQVENSLDFSTPSVSEEKPAVSENVEETITVPQENIVSPTKEEETKAESTGEKEPDEEAEAITTEPEPEVVVAAEEPTPAEPVEEKEIEEEIETAEPIDEPVPSSQNEEEISHQQEEPSQEEEEVVVSNADPEQELDEALQPKPQPDSTLESDQQEINKSDERELQVVSPEVGAAPVDTISENEQLSVSAVESTNHTEIIQEGEQTIEITTESRYEVHTDTREFKFESGLEISEQKFDEDNTTGQVESNEPIIEEPPSPQPNEEDEEEE